jgi:hypothetical protein
MLGRQNIEQIADAIAYDYARSFGRADSGQVIRALLTDRLLRAWLKEHPEGLSTAFITIPIQMNTSQRRPRRHTNACAPSFNPICADNDATGVGGWRNQAILPAYGGLMSSDALPVSPRLLALSQQLGLGNQEILPIFWFDVLAQGAPLVEPLPHARPGCEHNLGVSIWRRASP